MWGTQYIQLIYFVACRRVRRQELSLRAPERGGEERGRLHHPLGLRVPGPEVLGLLQGLRARVPLGRGQGGARGDPAVHQDGPRHRGEAAGEEVESEGGGEVGHAVVAPVLQLSHSSWGQLTTDNSLPPEEYDDGGAVAAVGQPEHRGGRHLAGEAVQEPAEDHGCRGGGGEMIQMCADGATHPARSRGSPR